MSAVKSSSNLMNFDENTRRGATTFLISHITLIIDSSSFNILCSPINFSDVGVLNDKEGMRWE
ncbi:hypothetical protein MetMK1DRAFT_00014220 [Metallosphaera yellowstonensis MK1]|uniref:Uncharacterized protein n=1 Tax=Metallosphaera yellowstonensis MK1 TaxID=671065 RepID=H2C423_9CREN|nr:hypothetical protein MetMK1DRAFT_00014220 [Metallosphaera yellowstonensis MK1]